MRWLLDTNVVSETALPRPNRTVLAWIARQPEDLVAISTVTLAELQDGINLTADDRRRTQLIQWLEHSVIPWLGERSLPVTLAGTGVIVYERWNGKSHRTELV